MKNVLLISPDTFGYYKNISAAIRRQGFNPVWLNQLPTTTISSRVFFRLMPGFGRKMSAGHFTLELGKITDVSQIIIIKGEGLSVSTIKVMRARYPNARIVYYLWDSLANVPGAMKKIEYCDTAFSFDPVDCDNVPTLKHLPLFHSRDPSDHSQTPGFAAFIGTLHSSRYSLITGLGKEIEMISGVKPFIYFYYPNKLLFRILRAIKKNFRRIPIEDVNFVSIPREKFKKIQSKSAIALDICHPMQSGLTMRTIEAIGNGEKLVTNNKTVKRYDFYRYGNCFVIDGALDERFAEFIKAPYKTYPSDVVQKYHIDSWICSLLAIYDD